MNAVTLRVKLGALHSNLVAAATRLPAATAAAAAVASSTAAEPQMRPSLHTAVELDAAG